MVTGCFGFIGSQFIRDALRGNDQSIEIVGVGRCTNRKNFVRLETVKNDPRLTIHYLDIDKDDLSDAFQDVDIVINMAAKTFVDYSIKNPQPFIDSNIVGTYRMLEEARRSKGLKLFFQVSTDEVYGAILEGAYKEDARLNPTNPYSATKAAGDMLVLSYKNTYGLPIIISRTENNYGPFQGREKVVPTFVNRALRGLPLPVFGDGHHKRMWLHVEDHVAAINHLIKKGKRGEIYHIAGCEELENIELAKLILKILNIPEKNKIEYIPDRDARPGHDRRYALDVEKLKATGWAPKWTLQDGFEDVVNWYLLNRWWFM